MGHWWNEEPWRLIQTNMRQIDMEDIDSERYVSKLKEFGATVAMINTGGIMASYRTGIEDHTVSEYLAGDSLKQVMEACKREGIRVIARMDFSKVRREVYEKHPDWAYRTQAGEIVDFNGDVHMCICGGFQQEKSFEIMKEAAETLPIDGVFINMGGFQEKDYSYRHYGLCHCDNCKRKFKEQFGLELPESESMDDVVFRKYKLFQKRVISDYKNRMKDMLRSINPEIAIDGVDFARIESNTEYKRVGPQWQYGSSSTVRGVQSLRPGYICSNAAVDFIGYFYRHVAVSPAMQSLRMWQDVANFGVLDYYMIGRLDNHKDRSGFEKVKKAFAYMAAHEEDYRGMALKADALLIRQGGYHVTGESCGWVRAFTESHIMLEETEPEFVKAETDLSHYKAIIVADIHTIPEETAQKLDDYVNKGGCLIITGETGKYDENGNERTNMPFESIGANRVLYHRNDMVSAMFELQKSDKLLLPSFTDIDVIYFGDDYLFAEYKDHVETYLHLIPPHPYGPPERCYYTKVTDLPGFTVHRYGKGKAVQIPWKPGLVYARDGYQNTFLFMKDVLGSVAGLNSVEDEPFSPMVEVILGWEKDKKYAMAHLVNGTGHFGTSFFEPVAVNGIKLKLPMDRCPSKVCQLVKGEEVPFRWNEGNLYVTVDTLEEMECIKIMFER